MKSGFCSDWLQDKNLLVVHDYLRFLVDLLLTYKLLIILNKLIFINDLYCFKLQPAGRQNFVVFYNKVIYSLVGNCKETIQFTEHVILIRFTTK